MTLRPVSILALLALLNLGTGCAALGNVLFTPHPASLDDTDATLALVVPCPPAAQMVPPALAGVALAALKAFLESEAARYRATYSAAASKTVGTTCFELGPAALATFKGKLTAGATATRLERGRFAPQATKAKVAAWPVRTWIKTGKQPFAGQGVAVGLRTGWGIINPIMWIHALWGWADGGLYEVDYAARIKIETIDASSKAHSSELVVPIGKFSIDEIAAGTASKAGIESGYVPRPAAGNLPTTLTVTIVEANELGDVVGQGAELVGEKGFLDKVKGFFGQ